MGELTGQMRADAAGRRGERPKVVIVGGGFAGIHAARALKDMNVSVTLIDRRNHHLFQPLLYQVALAVLSPADIAQPIRSILSNQQNAEVLMDEVVGIDVAARQLDSLARARAWRTTTWRWQLGQATATLGTMSGCRLRRG